MKKLLLTLVFAVPIFGFSQTLDFNNNLHGFNGASGFDATASATATILTGKTTGGPYVNPQLSNSTTANINAATNRMLKVILKNSNSSGPEYLRASFPKLAGGSVFKDVTITRGDTGFKTYYIDLTDPTNWVNTVNDFKLIFKAATNTNYTVLGGEIIEVDEMSFLAPGTSKNTYEFNGEGETEIFTASGTGASVSATGGNMIWTLAATSGQDFSQDFYTADLLNNRYIHIFYTNNSSNVQLRMSYKDVAGAYGSAGQNVAITASGSGEAIMDLSSKTDLTNNMNMKFNPRVATTTQAAGNIQIDRIVINNTSATLSTGDVSKAKNLLQVYVSDNTLNFRNANVSKATIFSMNGQLVKDAKVQNNAVDVSNLKAGVYMVKTVAQDNTETVTKFIKK